MKGQDLLVALAMIATEEGALEPRHAAPIAFADLARVAGMSTSETHAAVKRLRKAGLVSRERRVLRHALAELLLHGVKYVFPAERGPPSLGVPTASSAPALHGAFPEADLVVWPSPAGSVRGPSLEPLYRSAPEAALGDDRLYELLALVDCLRSGRAREQALAKKRLSAALGGPRGPDGDEP